MTSRQVRTILSIAMRGPICRVVLFRLYVTGANVPPHCPTFLVPKDYAIRVCKEFALLGKSYSS
jgi:hypothetical protein